MPSLSTCRAPVENLVLKHTNASGRSLERYLLYARPSYRHRGGARTTRTPCIAGSNGVSLSNGHHPLSGTHTLAYSNGTAPTISVPQQQQQQVPALQSPAVDPDLLKLMQQVAAGSIAPDAAARHLKSQAAGSKAVSDLANIDSSRVEKTGFPEVVWGPGKTAEQIAAILSKLAETQPVAMATRIAPEVHQAVQRLLPDVTYHPAARILSLKTSNGARKTQRLPGTVAILTEGTADMAVAEEARMAAELMGCYCFRIADVGASGLRRVVHNLPAVRAADVVLVVAGMDGALPSVVAGLVEAPVVAVPTSIGYGAAFNGLAPLLGSLTASTPGVCIVNIDNGFAAAMAAARILRVVSKLRNAAAGSTSA